MQSVTQSVAARPQRSLLGAFTSRIFGGAREARFHPDLPRELAGSGGSAGSGGLGDPTDTVATGASGEALGVGVVEV